MSGSWQDIVALVLVAATLAWLARRFFHCSPCNACHQEKTCHKPRDPSKPDGPCGCDS